MSGERTVDRHLDLAPVMQALGVERELSVLAVHSDAAWDRAGINAADWLLVSNNSTFMNGPSMRSRGVRVRSSPHSSRPWTDDYGNLLDALR